MAVAQSFRTLMAEMALALGAVALLVLLLWLPGRPAGALPLAAGTVFLVDSTADEPEADATTGLCSSFPSGKCTLRAAVMLANFVSGPTTITMPAGVYTLTRPGIEDDAFVGDLDLKKSVTIQGAGSGATIVDGNGAATGDRVIEILNTATMVRLTGLTIRGGQALTTTNGAKNSDGGGIYRDGTPSGLLTPELHLSDVVVEGNTATSHGGGIYAQAGLVELSNVVIRTNTAARGGGLDATNAASLTIRDSRVYSNAAVSSVGGGLDRSGSSDGRIERTEIYANTAMGGGGIAMFGATGRLTLIDSSVHHNQASDGNHSGDGGGILDVASSLTLLRTVVDANSADRYGGGIEEIDPLIGAVMIDQSTLSRNSAQFGGGIYYNDAGSRMVVVNSTLADNTAFRPVGAIGSSDGGGFYATGIARLSLDSVTIAGNVVNPGFGPQTHLARGGGLFISGTAVITAQNTLIGENRRSNGIAAPTGDDCSGSLLSLGYNLIQDLTNCSVSGTTTGNITGQIPKLGPLQDNGGTSTKALLAGSPAIDAGNPGGCLDPNGQPLASDQRGAPRALNGRCDIGAFEFGADPTLIAVSPVTVPTRPPFTLTLTGTGFLSGTVALWAGGSQTMMVVSGTQLLAAIAPEAVPVPGVYTVAVQYGVLTETRTAALTVTVTKADQTISFGPLPARTAGDAPFPVAASATSGLPVSFAVAGSCSVAGNIVSLTGAGSCTVTASQGGDAVYNPAPSVPQTFAIAAAGSPNPSPTPAPASQPVYVPAAFNAYRGGW